DDFSRALARFEHGEREEVIRSLVERAESDVAPRQPFAWPLASVATAPDAPAIGGACATRSVERRSAGPGVDELRRLLREADRQYYEALVAADTPVPPRPAAWRGPAAIAAALAAAVVLIAVSQLAPRRSGTIAAQPTSP